MSVKAMLRQLTEEGDSRAITARDNRASVKNLFSFCILGVTGGKTSMGLSEKLCT